MPRLVVVSIPGYNNSWWWGFGIPRDRTFESLPITSGVLLALGETGSMLRTVMMSVFGSRVPTILTFSPAHCSARACVSSLYVRLECRPRFEDPTASDRDQ